MAVFKLAQPGYDVKTAGDENLIFSASWPVLKIYKQDSVSYNVAQNAVLATHDLQFPPVFWYFTNNTEAAWENAGAIINTRRSEFFGAFGDGTIGMTDSQLKYTANGSPLTSGISQLYFYIFALDLTKQYTAPIIKVGAVGGGTDNKFVFKIAKDTKDLSSHDLSDYIIHSRARSPLIHSVNPSKGVAKTFQVNHGLGYTPMFFAYKKNTDGSYTMLPTGQGGSSNLLSDEQNITFTDTGGQEISIVVLKDPFLIDYSVRVNV